MSMFLTTSKKIAFYATVVTGAVFLTAVFFLVLPVLQTITKPPASDLELRAVNTTNVPPPPAVEEEPPPEEEQEEEPPPELEQDIQPLDLSQLEVALDPSFAGGIPGGDFKIDLSNTIGGDETTETLFSLSDLDQPPRAVVQTSPVMNAKLRRKAPATVNIIFIVDERGRVVEPQVQSSTDPIFERPALNAIKKWKFEPGLRDGEPVRFRMRIPITFPKR